jgi:hypothetical protein
VTRFEATFCTQFNRGDHNNCTTANVTPNFDKIKARAANVDNRVKGLSLHAFPHLARSLVSTRAKGLFKCNLNFYPIGLRRPPFASPSLAIAGDWRLQAQKHFASEADGCGNFIAIDPHTLRANVYC